MTLNLLPKAKSLEILSDLGFTYEEAEKIGERLDSIACHSSDEDARRLAAALPFILKGAVVGIPLHVSLEVFQIKPSTSADYMELVEILERVIPFVQMSQLGKAYEVVIKASHEDWRAAAWLIRHWTGRDKVQAAPIGAQVQLERLRVTFEG